MAMVRIALIALTVTLSSCLQTENSNTLDADVYGDVGGSEEFVAARTIFSQSCAGCHAFHTQTEAQLKAAELMVPGNPESSEIYYRLAGSSGAQGPKNMPSGSALSSSDLQTIRYWILNATP